MESYKKEIIIPVYYHIDEKGKTNYDFEQMTEDFEIELSKLDKSIVVMCSTEYK